MVWGDPINKWSYPLSACRCRMSSWALGRKSSVESEYINYCTIANVLNSPIGGQARFQLTNCIKVFVRAVSTTFGHTVDSFPSETLLISDSIFYSIVRQTCPYVVQIKRRDFSPFVVSVEVNFPSRLQKLPLQRSKITAYKCWRQNLLKLRLSKGYLRHRKPREGVGY